MLTAIAAAHTVGQVLRAQEERQKALAAATPHERILMQRQWEHDMRRFQELDAMRRAEEAKRASCKKDSGPGFLTGLFLGGIFF